MTSNLVLTDDEVVAVAALRGQAWPTPFTMVDTPVADADAARSAVRRGARSLLARGLLAMTGDATVLSDEVRTPLARMTSGDHLVVYPARGASPDDALYPLLYIHPGTDGEAIVELDAGDGIRGITAMAAADVVDHLIATARTVFRREESGDHPSVHIARIAPAGRSLVVVAPGEMVSSTVDENGSTTPTAVTPFFDTAIIRGLLTSLGLDQEEQPA